MHREIGLAILGLGVCLGLVAIVMWIGSQLDKARTRLAAQEWSAAVADLPEANTRTMEWDWPVGGAYEHFLGQIPYDPEAETKAFIEQMEADTETFIAQVIRSH